MMDDTTIGGGPALDAGVDIPSACPGGGDGAVDPTGANPVGRRSRSRAPLLGRLFRRVRPRRRPTGPIEIPVEKIGIRRTPPRRGIRPEAFAALERSIRRHGILSPIIVRPAPGGFEVIAGHLRLAAARRLGLPRVPAIIREVDDREAEAIRLAENAIREPLSEMDSLESMERFLLAGPQRDPRAAIEAEGLDGRFFLEHRDLLALPERLKEALALGLIDADEARNGLPEGVR